MLTSKDYVGQPISIRQGQDFQPFNSTGSQCVEMLPFLKGKPWNDLALGFVHGLRPSRVRVTRDGIQLDCQTWRVTVYLESAGDKILRIEQEVEVGLPEGVAHGADLMAKAMEREGSRCRNGKCG